MKTVARMTPVEFGAANTILLMNCRDAKTVKQAQLHWNRLEFFLRKQLEIINKHHELTSKFKLRRISKSYINTGETTYVTEWDDETRAGDEI